MVQTESPEEGSNDGGKRWPELGFSVASGRRNEEERGGASAPGGRQGVHGSPLNVNGAGEVAAWPQWSRHGRAHALPCSTGKKTQVLQKTPWTKSFYYFSALSPSVFYDFPPPNHLQN